MVWIWSGSAFCFLRFESAFCFKTELPESEETASEITQVDTEIVEGLDVAPTVTEAPERSEIVTIETTGDETTKPETEVVSHEFVVQETVQTVSEEVIQEEAPLPSKEEITPVSEVTEVSIPFEVEKEEEIPEESTTVVDAFEVKEQLQQPEAEEVPVHTAPEAVVVEEEEAPVQPEVLLQEVQREEVPEILQAPQFTQALSNVEILEGQPATFECKVTGIPVPEVTWRIDGEVIDDSPDFHIVQKDDGVCSLTITETYPEDEGEYECHAINTLGTATTKADLYIQGWILLSCLPIAYLYPKYHLIHRTICYHHCH